MGWMSDLLKPGWYAYEAGDLVKEGPLIDGVYGGFHQWRIKRTENGRRQFISLYFTPSFFQGSSGDRDSYLACFAELDLDAARRSRDCLREMIESLETGH